MSKTTYFIQCHRNSNTNNGGLEHVLSLSDATPVDSIRRLFPHARESVVAIDVQGFLANRKKDVPSTCMFIWDEMVHRGATQTPFKISSIIDKKYVGVYEFVEAELGRPPISDAYAVEFFNELNTGSFVELSLVECYPGDIHIADVEFADQSKPVAHSDPTGEFRKFKGLHLFDEFLERLRKVAKDRGAQRISLMVAFPPLYHVFARHGFQVGETEMAQAAHATFGTGHSMFIKI